MLKFDFIFCHKITGLNGVMCNFTKKLLVHLENMIISKGNFELKIKKQNIELICFREMMAPEKAK